MKTIDQIDEAIKQLAELKDSLLNEKQKPSQKWHPKGASFYLSCTGVFYKTLSDKVYREYGIEFDTEEAGMEANKVYRRYHRLYKLAEELNPKGWKPDFDNGTNYIVNYDHYVKKYTVDMVRHIEMVCGVYFSSLEIAHRAIKILENED